MRTAVPLAAPLFLTAAAAAQPLPPGFYGVLVGDADLDAVYIARDLNNNGHANDPGEAKVYFDATNASGLSAPADTVTDILWTPDAVFITDTGTDSVYRLRDLNRDDDANDPGEATVWFSAAGNFHGFRLPSPGGVAIDVAGFVYILGAGTSPEPFDAIYRARDLNNDGDAQDEGEATLWFDIQNLIPGSTPFDLVVVQGGSPSPAVYFTDGLGGAPDAIWRARDLNGNGTIDAGEFAVFIDETNTLGVPVSFGIAAIEPFIFTNESLASVSPQTIWSLRSDGPLSPLNVWDERFIPPPAPVALGTAFSIDGARFFPYNDVMALTSSGDESQDNVFVLHDRDGLNGFRDPGETLAYLTGGGPTAFPNSARSVALVDTACYADCDHSTGYRVLDIFDFLCFQNAYARADPYACECDQSGLNPCDIFDFLCFQNAYDRGCP